MNLIRLSREKMFRFTVWLESLFKNTSIPNNLNRQKFNNIQFNKLLLKSLNELVFILNNFIIFFLWLELSKMSSIYLIVKSLLIKCFLHVIQSSLNLTVKTQATHARYSALKIFKDHPLQEVYQGHLNQIICRKKELNHPIAIKTLTSLRWELLEHG